MKIFFSWSGTKSSALANHFKVLLKHIYYDVDVYYSSDDIKAGDKWRNNIEQGLDENSLGIIFLTESNLSSKWIYFEAGALTKAMKRDKIIPLLYDLKPSDIAEPLAAYQMKTYSKKDILDVIHVIGDSMDKKVDRELITSNFKEYWNIWKIKLAEIEKIEDSVDKDIQDGNVLDDPQKLDEILREVRNLKTTELKRDNIEFINRDFQKDEMILSNHTEYITIRINASDQKKGEFLIDEITKKLTFKLEKYSNKVEGDIAIFELTITPRMGKLSPLNYEVPIKRIAKDMGIKNIEVTQLPF